MADEISVRTPVISKSLDCAILDIQWSPHVLQHGDFLAVATSTGEILFYSLAGDEQATDLVPCKHGFVVDETKSLLVLFLAWHPTDSSILGYTLSDGSVNLAVGDNYWHDNTQVVKHELHRHDLEAWTLAFSDTQILSGGDDAVLALSSLDPTTNNSTTIWKDRKIHQAGVTAILPVPLPIPSSSAQKETTLVLTGSYDDHIRLLSLPTGAGRRKVLAELNLGGGVWRLKVLRSPTPTRPATIPIVEPQMKVEEWMILASCMHAGARIVSLRRRSASTTDNSDARAKDGEEGKDEEDEWSFDVHAKFEEHGSMNYASDVQPTNEVDGKESWRWVVSTSFYDCLLCLWRISI